MNESYPEFVRRGLRESFECNNDELAEKLDTMSRKEVLDAWLTWEGIIGFTDRIWEVARGQR